MDERATRRLGGQAGSSANAGNLPELGSKLIGKKKKVPGFLSLYYDNMDYRWPRREYVTSFWWFLFFEMALLFLIL